MIMTGFRKLSIDTKVSVYATNSLSPWHLAQSLLKEGTYMSNSSTSKSNTLNVELVKTLVQIIRSLSHEERKLLEQELFFDTSEPSTQELMNLAQSGGYFNFLYDEPDIYTLKDGERV